MTTERLQPAAPAADADAPLDRLLQRSSRPAPPARAEGIAIGRLESLDEDGRARVAIDAFGLKGLAASALIPLDATQVGRAIALGFENADPRRPIVLGLILEERPNAAPQPLSEQVALRQEGERVVLEAQGELELRCGDAVILLTADGQIHIRGGYITSHARAGQRIRGGSVQIN